MISTGFTEDVEAAAQRQGKELTTFSGTGAMDLLG